MDQPGEPIFGEVKAEIFEKRSFDIPVSGAPDVRITNTTTINPDRLAFSFSRSYLKDEPAPPWRSGLPTVSGPRRLLDGSLSEKSRHQETFYRARDTPQWVLDQVEKHRPKDEA